MFMTDELSPNFAELWTILKSLSWPLSARKIFKTLNGPILCLINLRRQSTKLFSHQGFRFLEMKKQICIEIVFAFWLDELLKTWPAWDFFWEIKLIFL